MGLSAAESNGRSQYTEALYREHGPAVAAYCRSLLRDGTEAEDATQQVFLSAHRALVNGSTPREPLPWLLAVARHECYARYRRRATAPIAAGDVPDGATPDASAHVLRAGELEVVWDEVGQMPAAQREAFLLREIRGLSYGQLAEELSLSASSVRSLLLRARARLRHRLRGAAAGLGGLPWVQAIVRLAAGGDGTPPVSAAAKAAVVGAGALALVGGGDVARVTHHPSVAQARPRHEARVRVPRTGGPAAAVAPRETRPGRDVRSPLDHSQGRDDGARASDPRSSGSSEASDDRGPSSGDSSTGSGRDGSNDTTAVVQTTTSGSDGSGSSSTGSGRDGSPDSSSDGGSAGSSSGPDGGSGTTTTPTTTSGSDGSGSGGHDGTDG